MERFESYLYGSKVRVESSHKPLESILKKSLLSSPKRLQRMMLRLQKFELELCTRGVSGAHRHKQHSEEEGKSVTSQV